MMTESDGQNELDKLMLRHLNAKAISGYCDLCKFDTATFEALTGNGTHSALHNRAWNYWFDWRNKYDPAYSGVVEVERTW